MRHAVIMAGGAGTRLWPLSRVNRPKQLLTIGGNTSLLRQSFERVSSLIEPERIYVITTQANLPLVAEALPELSPANVVGEPVGRDSASAVGLASAILARRDDDAVIGIFTADHMISPLDRFARAVRLAFQTAEENPDALVTIGVRPNRPDPNYGYIWRTDPIAPEVYEVRKFIEKPKVASAMKYLASGEYYWNSGMFTWRATTILEQLKKHLPATHSAVCAIADAWSTDARQQQLEKLYPELMRISIDFAVMERADRVLVVEMDCHWVDVGSWPAIEEVVHADSDGNVNACPRAIHLGSRGNIVVSEENHLITTIGVDDLVIVHSPDATLVCTKRDATGLRELIDNVRREFGEQYM